MNKLAFNLLLVLLLLGIVALPFATIGFMRVAPRAEVLSGSVVTVENVEESTTSVQQPCSICSCLP